MNYFEYADLPGFASIAVDGEKVTASVYSGVKENLWRTIDLGRILRG